MKTSIKIAAYAGVLAAAFGGAFGIGNLTGSPVEPSAAPPGEHEMDDAASTDAPSAPEADAGGHEAEAPAHEAEAAAHVPAGLQITESGYTLSPISAPASAGKAGTLSFTIDGPDGTPVTEFTEAHEKDLHLIVVRNDTTEYRHVHPVLDADGTWSIDWEWPAAGTYKVLADFEPTALGDGLTLARTLDVAGKYQPASLPADSAVAKVDGYTVTLTGDLAAGSSSDLTATIERDGRPVTDLQPYLGAYGHLVALRTGDLAYLHVHPEGEPGDGVTKPGPDVSFAVETPTAGTYRLFFDFQIAGQVRTAEFTLSTAGFANLPVNEQPSDDGSDDDGASHDDSDDDEHGH